MIKTFWAWLMDKEDDFWSMPHPPLPDPHDVESRKWFRRTLVTFCVVGFAVILVPPHWLEWFHQERRVWRAPDFVNETCTQVRITHGQVIDGNIGDVRTAEFTPDRAVWYDCTQHFSDGTVFRRIGDVKP